MVEKVQIDLLEVYFPKITVDCSHFEANVNIEGGSDRLLRCLPPIWRIAAVLRFSGSLVQFCVAVFHPNRLSSSCLHHGGTVQYSREGERKPVARKRVDGDETFCQSLRNTEMLQAVEDNARAW